MKEERNRHGAVDKSSSEQWIRIVDVNYILCEKNWTRTRSRTGSYGRWQVADEIQVNLEIFRNHCTSKDLTLLRLTKVQHHAAVEMHSRCFLGKIYCKPCILKCKNS